LGSCNFDRSLELHVRAIFGLFSGRHQQQFAALPVKLDIAPALATCVRDSKRVFSESKPSRDPCGLSMDMTASQRFKE
jgi:hypothetical protein